MARVRHEGADDVFPEAVRRAKLGAVERALVDRLAQQSGRVDGHAVVGQEKGDHVDEVGPEGGDVGAVADGAIEEARGVREKRAGLTLSGGEVFLVGLAD